MRQKRYQGFTLIELLAVIVILAVIALIATPLIMSVINDAKKGAARDAGYSVIKAGELAAATSGIENTNPPYHYDETSNLPMKGTKPTKFILDINKDMDTQLRAWINGFCVIKNYGNETVTIDETKNNEADCVKENLVPFVQHILSKNVSGNKEGLITDNTAQKNVRYAGLNVNNYVIFNNETWRVIGIFDGKVKIVSDQPSDKNFSVHNTNNWPISEIATYLNDEYYESLTSNAKAMIDDTKYYLGSASTSYYTKKEMYEKERGNEVGACSPGTVGCPRPTDWTGKIALMYPSDYGYAAGSSCSEDLELADYDRDECRQNNWLFQEEFTETFITPAINTGYSYTRYYRWNSGHITVSGYTNNPKFRPALYLNPDVSYVGGTGTKNDPYIIK